MPIPEDSPLGMMKNLLSGKKKKNPAENDMVVQRMLVAYRRLPPGNREDVRIGMDLIESREKRGKK